VPLTASSAFVERTLDLVETMSFDALPAPVIDRTRWILVDTLGVIAAAMQEPEMRALVDRLAPGAAGGDAWVVGAGRRGASQPAAFLNGTAAPWLELDEGCLLGNGHPGSHVIPAALAFAQSHGCAGSELLRAIALGYEACARLGGGPMAKPWSHPYATPGTNGTNGTNGANGANGANGVIGAAIACGVLARASRDTMRHIINLATAMGLASSRESTRESMREGATVRNVFSGHSGIAGQIVPQLAAAGFRGQGMGGDVTFAQFSPDGVDPARYAPGPGERWVMLDNYFKLYPCSRAIHSAIDALRDALSKVPGGRLAAAAVDCIEVRTFKHAALLDVKSVTTVPGAKFSLPFALATVLAHDGWDLAVFGGQGVANQVVQSLLQRVHVAEEPAYTAKYPEEQVTDLRIHMQDGRMFRGYCDIMRGEPANPHDPATLTAKFMNLAGPVWGREKAERLLADCLAIERVADLRDHARTHDV